ncbi:MAG: efflux RND transporter permease subunit [Hyphomicrobiales bacterium]|nr:efflux RND transporter permease subunit [Hyphomicrobiales bacterium]
MPDTNLPHDPTQSVIARVIEWSVRNPLLISILALAILAGGIRAIQHMPLDAIPDLSDTQVIIRTDFDGQAPKIVEDLVTYPLSSAMLGVPRAKVVRGYSMYGDSFIYIIFKDGTDLYWARARVLEALSRVQSILPEGAKVQLGPDATGVGWVYQYALVDKSGKHDLAELRAIQDWFLKYELATVPGVAEVASVGGFVKEYQVMVDPHKAHSLGIPLTTIADAIRSASIETGGRTIEQAETEFIVRSEGYVTTAEDLENIVIHSIYGIPSAIRDVARVIEGPELRRGVTELNGEGEVPAGIIVMRPGSNALDVIHAVKEKIAAITPGLPEGVEIVPVYDRAPLIEGSVQYLSHKLIEEAIVVSLVCLIFLLHVRSSFVAIVTLPLGILAAFNIMSWQSITANIMSLGGIAIAIGAMVDASIVMVENAHRKLSMLEDNATATEKRQALLLAAKEVGPGLFFSLLIITVSFLPVFALTGQSERLFSPLAYTKTYAMAAAALLSVTVVPLLMLWLIRGRLLPEEKNPINRFFIACYTPILKLSMKAKWLTLTLATALLLSAVWPLMRTGTEFMPALYEGELLYMPVTLPGVSITKAKDILQTTNRIIKSVPEVETVFGKAGRSDTATDPAPLAMIETWIRLKPKAEWRKGMTIQKLIQELDQKTKMPGLINSFGYPIKIRIDMVSTGIRTPIGIKVSGPELAGILDVALQVEQAVKTIPGTRSAFADRVKGAKYLTITPNREAMLKEQVDMETLQQVIASALGGMKLSESVQGRERYGIILRYDRPFRETIEDVSRLLVPSPNRKQIMLGELADVHLEAGPPMIVSENARLNGWVYVDIADRDIGSYVADAQKQVAEKVTLPPGYSISWSGQFEQMLEARTRLQIAIPAVIAIIFVLLVMHFGRMDRTLMVMLSLPFGLTGGIWLLYLAGYHFSVAVAVGFIALAGIAAETAVVMLIYLDQQVRLHPPKNRAQLFEAVMHGAALRVRPKLMTVSVIIAGLLPVFLTDGLGADVMRRIALPMVGGMLSTTLLTLIVIPVVYYIWEGRRYK